MGEIQTYRKNGKVYQTKELVPWEIALQHGTLALINGLRFRKAFKLSGKERTKAFRTAYTATGLQATIIAATTYLYRTAPEKKTVTRTSKIDNDFLRSLEEELRGKPRG